MGCDVKNDWCEFRKIVDTKMCLFIKKGPRGRISDIAKRNSVENNKYMKNYDSKKLSKFIT